MLGIVLLTSASAQLRVTPGPRDTLLAPGMERDAASRYGRDEMLLGASFLSEGPIDPATYEVGPGDRFQLVVWGAVGVAHEISVAPEGVMFIPNVGVIPVKGLTLDDARAKVREEVLGVYSKVKVELILIEPRRFKVYVAGAVLRPGSYPATAVTRVSDVVGLAGGLSLDASRRGVFLRRPGRDPLLVDLAAYELTGSLERNPFLSDGAIVEVPKRTTSILLSGGVVNPGYYEPIPGERLSELLQAVGGLEPAADTTRFVMSRFVEPDRTAERAFAYRPGGELDEDPILIDGDRIFVRVLPDYHRPGEVHVQGAVVRPGRYPIPVDGASVSSVIASAGGFTSRANLAQAHILRPRQRWTPVPQPAEAGTPELNRGQYEQAHALATLDSVLVTCDFVALFESGSADADVMLHDGDVIQVPEDRGEVRVIGLVRRPGAYAYAEGRSVRDYVDLAGGYDKDADKGRTQIAPFGGAPLRRAKGSQQVAPGAVVYVPPREQKTFLERTREATGFLVQLASLVVIIDTISR